MIYGILTFVFQMASCREANREMTRPMFWQNLQYFFPELESLPHHDTLKRLLSKIDINQIEDIHLDLIRKLKAAFPALKIMVLLDGLYPKGSVVEICRKNKWQFMMVLQDDALPSVTSEFEALKNLEGKNRYRCIWGNRKQFFRWVNDIDYRFGKNGRKSQILHVVECKESWQEINPETGKPEERCSRHVWLSSEPLDRRNLHERCNLGARSRWCIESGILVEKHHGYQYEPCFSYDWNAMKGYHALMRIGHMLNVLARYSERMTKIVNDTGVRGLIRFLRETMASPWLNYRWQKERLAAPFLLRLV
jgi:hypothetical protein